jgi:hypothetical protein
MITGIIIIFLVLFILAAGAALFTKMWDPLWNPFRPKPAVVIAAMAAKMAAVETLHSDFNGTFNLTGGTEMSVTAGVSSDIDSRDEQNLKTGGQINVDLTMAGNESSFGMQGRQIGPTFYLDLTAVPSTPLVSPIAGIQDFSGLKDQWIKIDGESLLNVSAVETLNNFLQDANLYSLKAELPDGKIGSVSVYHYQVSLSNDELKKIIALPEQAAAVLGFSMDDFIDKAGEFSAELWIGKKDNLLYGFKMTKSFDLANVIIGQVGQASLNMNVNFSKFNQPVTIEVPAQSETLQEAMAMVEKAQLLQKDSKIASDMAQLGMIAELIRTRDNSYEFLCTDRTSLLNATDATYGADISNLESDIRELQSGILFCYDSAASYCIISDLASADKGRWCTDSAGTAKEVDETKGCAGRGTLASPFHCP